MSDGSSGQGGFGDSVTEVSSTGYFARIGQSLIGMLVGFVLVAGAIALIFWNEGRAVEAIRGLKQGAAVLVEAPADHVDPAQDGRLVHLTAALAVGQPAEDPVLGIRHAGSVRLRREADMFQWVEHSQSESHTDIGGRKTTETTYTYRQEWSENPIDSTRFHLRDGHQNPQMAVRTATFDGHDATLGGRTLTSEVMPALTFFTPLSPPSTAHDGFVADGGQLYRGANPNAPAIGDIRVHYSAVPTGEVSMMAAQRGSTLVAFRSGEGYVIALAAPGAVPAADMLREKGQEESQLTWILRGVGFVGVLIGLLLVAAPLSTLASVIPFLGSIVGGGVFLLALGLAIPITLVTVGVAWLAVRPLLGGGLISGAIVAYVALRMLRPSPRRA